MKRRQTPSDCREDFLYTDPSIGTPIRIFLPGKWINLSRTVFARRLEEREHNNYSHERRLPHRRYYPPPAEEVFNREDQALQASNLSSRKPTPGSAATASQPDIHPDQDRPESKRRRSCSPISDINHCPDWFSGSAYVLQGCEPCRAGLKHFSSLLHRMQRPRRSYLSGQRVDPPPPGPG